MWLQPSLVYTISDLRNCVILFHCVGFSDAASMCSMKCSANTCKKLLLICIHSSLRWVRQIRCVVGLVYFLAGFCKKWMEANKNVILNLFPLAVLHFGSEVWNKYWISSFLWEMRCATFWLLLKTNSELWWLKAKQVSRWSLWVTTKCNVQSLCRRKTGKLRGRRQNTYLFRKDETFDSTALKSVFNDYSVRFVRNFESCKDNVANPWRSSARRNKLRTMPSETDFFLPQLKQTEKNTSFLYYVVVLTSSISIGLLGMR